MKCINCNSELSDDTKFCTKCGTKVEIKEDKKEEEIIKEVKEPVKEKADKRKKTKKLNKVNLCLLIITIISLTACCFMAYKLYFSGSSFQLMEKLESQVESDMNVLNKEFPKLKLSKAGYLLSDNQQEDETSISYILRSKDEKISVWYGYLNNELSYLNTSGEVTLKNNYAKDIMLILIKDIYKNKISDSIRKEILSVIEDNESAEIEKKNISYKQSIWELEDGTYSVSYEIEFIEESKTDKDEDKDKDKEESNKDEINHVVEEETIKERDASWFENEYKYFGLAIEESCVDCNGDGTYPVSLKVKKDINFIFWSVMTYIQVKDNVMYEEVISDELFKATVEKFYGIENFRFEDEYDKSVGGYLAPMTDYVGLEPKLKVNSVKYDRKTVTLNIHIGYYDGGVEYEYTDYEYTLDYEGEDDYSITTITVLDRGSYYDLYE